MNRAERRAGPRSTRKVRRLLGFYSPIRKPENQPTPRYVRRHMKNWPGMATRRARKERARVQRALDRRFG
jgi:hypothetical protein